MRLLVPASPHHGSTQAIFRLCGPQIAVAFHVCLLQVGRQTTQIFRVGDDRVGAPPHDILVPMAQRGEHDWHVVLQRRTCESTSQAPSKNNSKLLRPTAMHRPTGPHMEYDTHPILKPKRLRRKHAEGLRGLQVGGHRHELL